MWTILRVCFLAALLGQFMAQAKLTQKPNYPDGLGTLLDLGTVLPVTSSSYSIAQPPADDCNLQECHGTMTTSTASFGDTAKTILICVCEGAQMDLNSLVYGMSQVPLFIRQHVPVITSIPSDNAHAYTYPDTGHITLFGFVQFDVFIHEAAHAQDQGFSSSDTFKNALAGDTCVPDDYATTNEVECYAQDMVVFLYQLWKKTTPAPGTDCMSNQLSALHGSNAPGLQDYINSVP